MKDAPGVCVNTKMKPKRLMDVKVIIFDFDGVILESQGIKDAAFKELFKKYPQHINAIMTYHHAHTATVRFDKFRYITENILKEAYTPDIEKNLGREFSDFVFERIMKCPFVIGVMDFLEYYYPRIPFYIASVNPAADLARIIEGKHLTKYFKKVYTSPWEKKDAIKDILDCEEITAGNAVFIGDTIADCQAAKANDVFFIGRNSGESFPEADIPVFQDFKAIQSFFHTETKGCIQ